MVGGRQAFLQLSRLVVMAVAPIPILLLLIAIELAKVAIFTMILDYPLVVVNSFVIVPAVIVVVVRIVHAITVAATASGQGGREECDGEE